jgi:FtsP/CotA-like multicopper oxidase with cupredoxin domain
VRSCRRAGSALALPALAAALAAAPAPAGAATRVHWIAAVPTTLNVVPNQRNAFEGERFTRAETTVRTVVYRAYTRNWGRPLPNRPQISADNDRIPGPLIRARVGDSIVVHFRNDDMAFHRPHSMHFHGVHYPFSSDGSFIPGFSGRGADVAPGQTFTYRLTAGRDSVGVWPYHDHSPSMDASIAGGMYGALSIRGPRERAPDREFVVFFESLAGFNTINGRAFVGNTPVFHARIGDRVQWDVLALGDETHTFHVHGHRWRDAAGTPEDTRAIGPAESFRVRWNEDRAGTWLYHCHVESHMMHGMVGIYRVRR